MKISKLIAKIVDRSIFLTKIRRKKNYFFSRMQLSWYRLFSKKEIFHYIHITKTGGTMLKHILQPKKRRPYVTNDKVIFIHDHWFTLNHVKPGEKVFFFVRDPARRFVSRFYQRKKGDYVEWNENRWNKLDKEIYETYPTANEFAEILESIPVTYYDFPALCNTLSRWLVSIDLLKKRIEDGTIVFVGQVENFDADFERLKQILQISTQPIEIPNKEDMRRRNTMPTVFDTHLSTLAKSNVRNYFSNEYEMIAFLKENYISMRS